MPREALPFGTPGIAMSPVVSKTEWEVLWMAASIGCQSLPYQRRSHCLVLRTAPEGLFSCALLTPFLHGFPGTALQVINPSRVRYRTSGVATALLPQLGWRARGVVGSGEMHFHAR